MPEAAKVVGIVGHIGPYDPKSMEWSTYKGRFLFYLQANSITDAALKRATLLTLIGYIAYRMLADLHLPDDLSTVNFDTLIADLESAFGKKVSELASRVRFQYRQSESTSSVFSLLDSERFYYTVYSRCQRHIYQYGSRLRFMLFSLQFRLVESPR